MQPKDGVDMSRLMPELSRLEPIIDLVYAAFGKDAIVTATYGGRHKQGSLHYNNAAVDLRVKHVGEAKMQVTLHAALTRQIALAYPGQYDVLLEDAGGDNAHIHIEPSTVLVAQMDFGKAA